jgi:peptide deformylase
MCFPDLLVKVRRNTSISITFMDEQGQSQRWEHLGQAESELLQHEIDHLDGVLAIDLALDTGSIIYRTAFEADPTTFQSQVDYVIRPTI